MGVYITKLYPRTHKGVGIPACPVCTPTKESNTMHTTLHCPTCTHREGSTKYTLVEGNLFHLCPYHKERAPMHYKLTLNTHTTMVWLTLLTLATLMCLGVYHYTTTTSWGGLHTLSYVGMVFSLMGTVCMGATHWYVRTHKAIVLSTNTIINTIIKGA